LRLVDEITDPHPYSTFYLKISKLSEWSFSESLLATLPADKEHGNLIRYEVFAFPLFSSPSYCNLEYLHPYRSHIPNVIFSHIRPTPFVTKPKIVAVR